MLVVSQRRDHVAYDVFVLRRHLLVRVEPGGCREKRLPTSHPSGVFGILSVRACRSNFMRAVRALQNLEFGDVGFLPTSVDVRALATAFVDFERVSSFF